MLVPLKENNHCFEMRVTWKSTKNYFDTIASLALARANTHARTHTHFLSLDDDHVTSSSLHKSVISTQNGGVITRTVYREK